MGFCGILDHRTGRADFATLRKMCGLHGYGCAFVNGEYGIVCSGSDCIEGDGMQPITLKYNNALYTAAIICDTYDGQSAVTAEGVLEGYIEEGESFIGGLDFPYALALYDGRCGELMLAKGASGDKPLFYSISDGAVYFATSLRSLFRLFGGCVRVRKNVLAEHILGSPEPFPEQLFCDIKPLYAGQTLLCSRLGDSLVDTPRGTYFQTKTESAFGEALKITALSDLRRCLTDALFTFDYPQFDYLLPYLTIAAKEHKSRGERRFSFCDAFFDINAEYTTERAERVSAATGIRLISMPAEREKKHSRPLKIMEKDIDAVLSEYLDDPSCVLNRLVDADTLNDIDDEKSIPLRIRRKGMLCQTAMWFESYNLVLV